MEISVCAEWIAQMAYHQIQGIKRKGKVGNWFTEAYLKFK